MKVLYNVKLAIILMTAHLKHTCLFIAINCISFVLIVLTIAMVYVQHINKMICSSVLKDVNNIGVISMDAYDYDIEMGFYDELINHKDILASGCIDNGGFDIIPDIYKIQQKEMNDPYYKGSPYTKRFAADYNFLPMIKYKLYKQKELSEEKLARDDYYYLYLGYNFRNIELGTKYDLGFGILEVAGIFKKDQEMINPKIPFGAGENEMLYNVNMNNEIMMISNKCAGSNYMFQVKGNNFDKVTEDIYKIADKYDMDITIGKLSSNLDNASAKTKVLWKYLLKLFIVFYIASFIIGICLQFIEIRRDIYEYTCMRLTGLLQKDMVIIFAIENGLKLLMTFLLSAGISGFFMQAMWNDGLNQSAINIIFVKSLFSVGLISLLVAFAVSMILPMYFVRKYSIKELMTEVL